MESPTFLIQPVLFRTTVDGFMKNLLLAQQPDCYSLCISKGGGTSNCAVQCTSSQGINNPAVGTLNKYTGIQFFQKLIPSLVGLAFVIGAIIFFFMLVIGAIQWISSGGDKGNLEAARGRITSALIGIVVLFSIFVIIKVIENFFGVHILTLDIGSLIIK